MIGKPEEPELFGPVIHSYSRADALRDGVLVDVSALAREAGIKYPVAVTAGVFAVLAPWAGSATGDVERPEEGQPLHGTGQSFTGRAWDLLTILRLAMKGARAGADRVDFAPYFLMDARRCDAKTLRPDEPAAEPVALYALVGPGDEMEAVVTVLLPDED